MSINACLTANYKAQHRIREYFWADVTNVFFISSASSLTIFKYFYAVFYVLCFVEFKGNKNKKNEWKKYAHIHSHIYVL